MLSRYPHTANLKVVTEIEQSNGIPTTEDHNFDILGRFEPAASKSDSIDYKAKFYCQNFDMLLEGLISPSVFTSNIFAHNSKQELTPFSVDGQTLTYRGKNFEIVLLHNYQTHCEIWLD